MKEIARVTKLYGRMPEAEEEEKVTDRLKGRRERTDTSKKMCGSFSRVYLAIVFFSQTVLFLKIDIGGVLAAWSSQPQGFSFSGFSSKRLPDDERTMQTEKVKTDIIYLMYQAQRRKCVW
mgnify:CR=1 FL=1